jgi:hypothetical protein
LHVDMRFHFSGQLVFAASAGKRAEDPLPGPA